MPAENKKNSIKDKLNKLGLFICLAVVFMLFVPTFTRPFLIYDERIITDGIYFATPKSISEIFEIIQNFGLQFNVLSSNTLYSTNCVTRTSPFGQIYWLFLNFFFQKINFFYYTLNLILHLMNTCLIFFILKILTQNRYIVTILTLLWAIHPVNVESVLLVTNSGALISYIFFFSFTLDFLVNKNKNTNLSREILIPILFLIPMLLNEYIVTLPLVLFVFSFQENYHALSLKKAFRKSLEQTKPYLTGLILYIIYFLFFSNHIVSQIHEQDQIKVLFERIFWLSPQIFFHLLKLVFFPQVLSIDQTIFVKLGNTLLDPYAIFCIIFLACWLILPLLIFILTRKFSNIFTLCWTFFFGLLPFLHILAPSYLFATERYLYCPLALFIFCLAKLLLNLKKPITIRSISIFLSILCIILIARSHFRTLEWKDNYTFINSSYKLTKDTFYRAIKPGMLAKIILVTYPQRTKEATKHYIKALTLLEEAKIELKEKEKKYQKSLPLIIKSYGLDYSSLLTKIAYLEATTLYLELNQDYKIAFKVLSSAIKEPKKTDARILQLYAHLLLKENKFKEAKEVLLAANSNYPHMPFVLLDLIDLIAKYEKDNKGEIEKYLTDGLKYHSYDPNLLLKALAFYKDINKSQLAAKYGYLYGLRTGSQIGYQQALVNYLNAEDLKNAKRTINKLLKIDPHNLETKYFISKYYYKTKEYQKALEILKEAYSMSKSPPIDKRLAFDIGHTLARLYFLLGKNETAIEIAKELKPLAINDKEASTKLTFLYKSLGLIKT